jgi:hypothetical protein
VRKAAILALLVREGLGSSARLAQLAQDPTPSIRIALAEALHGRTSSQSLLLLDSMVGDRADTSAAANRATLGMTITTRNTASAERRRAQYSHVPRGPTR